MSDETTTLIERISESRREFLQKGAAASGAIALGLGGLGFADSGAARQQEGNETDAPDGTDTPDGGGASAAEGESGKALMYNDEFQGGAQFRVKSPVVEENPDAQGVEQGNIFSEYNTRVIEYLNTDEDVYFFPAHEAEIQQGEVYELHDNFTLFADDAADSGVIDVRFEPVPEEGVLVPGDGNRLDPLDDFDIVEGGGKALVQSSNFFPGALLEVTSGVVEWTPGPNVQGSDIFSEYNTRHARYLNTGDEFLLYPAHEADIQEDGVYLIRDEFDITDPEGQLVTADIDRVNEDDLDDAWFEDDGTDTGTATGTGTGTATDG